MKKRIKFSHNLSDVELEEILEKALKGVKKYQEPNRKLPDKLANKLVEEQEKIFEKVINNMISEIKKVITS